MWTISVPRRDSSVLFPVDNTIAGTSCEDKVDPKQVEELAAQRSVYDLPSHGCC